MIRDLEEILLTILDPNSRAFMREAVQSYHAGAFRAAVVLSMAAGMDDLRQKLASLATSGGAPGPVKTASADIDKLFRDQQAFESTLIDACEKDAQLLSPAEAAHLRVLLKLRHLCAHPSGHAGTAEEARASITSIVDLVLARPTLMGMSLVDELMNRLASPYFFPARADRASVMATAASELKNLHPSFHVALVKRTYALLLGEARAFLTRRAASVIASRSPTQHNARQLLAALCWNGSPGREVVWKYIGDVIEKPEASDDTLWLLAADPEGLALADPLTRDRAVALARANLGVHESRVAIRQWCQTKVVTEPERAQIITDAIAQLVIRWKDYTPEAVDELAFPELDAIYFPTLVERAGNSTWAIANPAVSTMLSLTPERAAAISPALQAEFILRVAANSTGPYASRECESIRLNGLGARADFINGLAQAAAADPERLLALGIDWKNVPAILKVSGREDVLQTILAVFSPPRNSAIVGCNMLAVLEAHTDQSIASAAKASASALRAWMDTQVTFSPG